MVASTLLPEGKLRSTQKPSRTYNRGYGVLLPRNMSYPKNRPIPKTGLEENRTLMIIEMDRHEAYKLDLRNRD